jgi:site-specific recombinase XerD
MHLAVLRHSCGVHLSQGGASAEVIRDRLGHRAAQSASVYMPFSRKRRANVF